MSEIKLKDVLPNLILLNMNQIQSLGIMKETMAKKLIQTRVIDSLKIGNKLHVARHELIRYLEAREDTESLDDVIPRPILFNLKEIENYGIIKVNMLKNLIRKNELKATYIGNKAHIARHVLIEYLEKNTIKRLRSEIMNI